MDEKNVFGCHDLEAENYDEEVNQNLDDYLRENYFKTHNKVIELLELDKGNKLLDIGIGTGLLAEKIHNDVDVTGIDISNKMMNKLKEKNLSVKLTYGHFLDIPFADNSFNRLVSTYAFHHLTFKEKILAYKEMDRVLDENGIIVIGDLMYKDKETKERLLKKFKDEKKFDLIEELEDDLISIK